MSSENIGDENNPGSKLKLQFANLQHQDAGLYKCDAINGAGSDSKIVNLEVQCKFGNLTTGKAPT